MANKKSSQHSQYHTNPFDVSTAHGILQQISDFRFSGHKVLSFGLIYWEITTRMAFKVPHRSCPTLRNAQKVAQLLNLTRPFKFRSPWSLITFRWTTALCLSTSLHRRSLPWCSRWERQTRINLCIRSSIPQAETDCWAATWHLLSITLVKRHVPNSCQTNSPGSIWASSSDWPHLVRCRVLTRPRVWVT